MPLRAILRHRQRSGSSVPARLLYSSRTLADVIYHSELDQYRGSAEVRYTLTRSQPPGWGGFSGRVDAALLARSPGLPASIRSRSSAGPPPSSRQLPNLVALRYPAGRVKTERFGGA